MCGIAGFCGKGTMHNLSSMTRSLTYRGPDDEGYFFDAKEGVGMGHRRLSIIDLSPQGRNPIYNEDKTVLTVFNGEIYNFLEIKKELQIKGHTFTTQTDTEIIVHAYEEYGENCFAKFNGMFAIALWDTVKKKLLLARDPLGEKPLYYFWNGTTFLFASELHALSNHPLFEKKVTHEEVWRFFFFNCFPAPYTPFKNTWKVCPGEFVILHNNTVEKKAFSSFTTQKTNEHKKISFKEACDELDNLLSHSTQKRIVADVPVGVLLSGGIDSSTVAWYAARASTHKLNTFALGFKEKNYNEADDARAIAHHLKTEHHELIVKAEDLFPVFDVLPTLMSDPIADPSILPTTILSQFTRQTVTVALGGDGGDELFCGYPTFQAERFAFLLEKTPEILKKLTLHLGNALPHNDGYMNMAFKIKRLLRTSLPGEDVLRHATWLAPETLTDLHHILLSKCAPEKTVASYLRSMCGEPSSEHKNIINFYLKFYLAEQVLQKVDRASMYHALEVRAPFLDHTLVNFSLNLPYQWKLHGMTTKFILKKLMEKRLPQQVLTKKKHGFAVPLAQWFRGPLKPYLTDILSSEAIKQAGILNPSVVHSKLERHFDGTEDNHRILWNMLLWHLWTRHYT